MADDEQVDKDERREARRLTAREHITKGVLTVEEHTQRVIDAMAMRRQGKTWDEVAAAHGWKSRQAAHIAVTKELRRRAKFATKNTDAMRQEQLDRLEEQYARLVDVADRRHAVLFKGDDTGFDDSAPIVRAVSEMTRVIDRIAKLYGLDAPQQVVADTQVRYEVVGVDPTDVT